MSLSIPCYVLLTEELHNKLRNTIFLFEGMQKHQTITREDNKMPTVYARHGEKYYKLNVSPQWCEKNDNGALVSCGLTVGENLRETQLLHLIRTGKAKEVSQETWKHSGCQSGCVLRGDPACRW
jgi:hypothetical protein